MVNRENNITHELGSVSIALQEALLKNPPQNEKLFQLLQLLNILEQE